MGYLLPNYLDIQSGSGSLLQAPSCPPPPRQQWRHLGPLPWPHVSSVISRHRFNCVVSETPPMQWFLVSPVRLLTRHLQHLVPHHDQPLHYFTVYRLHCFCRHGSGRVIHDVPTVLRNWYLVERLQQLLAVHPSFDNRIRFVPHSRSFGTPHSVPFVGPCLTL